MQKVTDLITKGIGIEPVLIKLKNVIRGKAHGKEGKKRYITFPEWVLEREPEFILYYLVHEICHILEYDLFGKTNHDEYFKKLEQTILAKFQIGIKYEKVYAREVYKLEQTDK